MLAEQFLADGPKLQLYNFAEKHWEDLMNWQHATMYLFFGLAATVSLVLHSTEAAPLALDRLMLAVAFFNEGTQKGFVGYTDLSNLSKAHHVHLVETRD